MTLEDCRKEKGLSRNTVAKAMDVTEQTIFNAERKGMMSNRLLMDLADFFQVSTDCILGRDDVGK